MSWFIDKLAMSERDDSVFWSRPTFLLFLALLSGLPLLLPDVPPLLDLPAHMGRYRVQLDLANSPELQRFYDFKWSLTANLGVDLLVVPLSGVFGLELAVKIIAIAVLSLTVAGFLLVAREVHGWVPPTALFALPLAFNLPFLLGFLNFSLSMALALLAFALWLRMARAERPILRGLLFIPISLIVWVSHAYGWGFLGLLVFGSELVRRLQGGQGLIHSAVRAGLECLWLCAPFLIMVFYRTGGGAQIGQWFDIPLKARWLVMVMRDRWMWFDVAAVALIGSVLTYAVLSRRFVFSPALAAAGLMLAAAYLILPHFLLGSAHGDTRLAPYLFAVALLAVGVRASESAAFKHRIALLALGFFAVRLAASGASFWLYDQSYDRELAALDHVPEGARVVAFVGSTLGRDCQRSWHKNRLDHLPGMAIVRRKAFVNSQFTVAGAHLLTVDYPAGGYFVRNPSHLVMSARCPLPDWTTLEWSLANFPRPAFDYLWLIDAPEHDPRLVAGLTPVWRSGHSALFRVEQR